MKKEILLSNEADDVIKSLKLNLKKSLKDCEKIHDINEKEAVETILNRFKKETFIYINRYKNKELRKQRTRPLDMSEYFVKYHTGGIQ